ncbi:MAG TPA: alpha/beta hydrolase [Dokdonella sp.]|nr:alpha/beta hydrolase [Dokdonella sp.]
MDSWHSNSSLPPPTVLCVHGAGAGGWEWGIWARVLAARGLRTLTPDLVPADAGLSATRFEDYRGQVLEWAALETAGSGQPPILVGASLGGLLALSVAAAVKSPALILVNPMPPRGIVSKPLGSQYPAVLRWGSNRSIAGTREAMRDADDAACLFAFRRWRDESGLALEQARLGMAVDPPRCPALVMASDLDADVPLVVSRELAMRYAADFEQLAGCSHVGPLLGARAAGIAARAADWLLSPGGPAQPRDVASASAQTGDDPARRGA